MTYGTEMRGDPTTIGSIVLREIGRELASHLGHPTELVMRLMVMPEVNKLSIPFDQLTSSEHDAFLQRLALRIVSLDGRRRDAFLARARRIR
ncbi:MAG: hypothetical protein AB7P03_29590 [Kofleriaceae bacterium]